MIHVVNVRRFRTTKQRQHVCYVGRKFAGWLGHPLANPFRLGQFVYDGDTKEEIDGACQRELRQCLERYAEWLGLRESLDDDLALLWEQCEHGARPLGCWCVESIVPGGALVQCHAEILAMELVKRYGRKS